MKKLKLLTFIYLSFLSWQISGQVSGTVFRDFNANGILDNSTSFKEIGLDGVVVNAVNATGAALTVTYVGGGSTTNSTGQYSVTGGVLGSIRLEFVLPSNYFATIGTTGGTTIMFPTSATQNLAVNYPQDFTVQNPPVATPIYINGNSQVAGSTSTSVGLVRFPYDNGSVNNLSQLSNIGAVWGLAYHKQSGKLFSSAFGKRHVSWGPLGPNGIYVTPNAKTANGLTATSNFVNLNTINSSFDAGLVTRNFNPGQGTPTNGNYDENMFDQVGKVGMGDIDVSDDGMYLYAINLNDRSLWRIVVGVNGNAPTLPSQIEKYTAIPNPCTNSTFRPFAVKYFKGDIYVGGVCDGVNGTTSTSTVDRNNLKATIYKVSASSSPSSSSFTEVFSFPLTFNRNSNLNYAGFVRSTSPYVDPNGTNNALTQASWHPWARSFTDLLLFNASEVHYPQPVLMDIEFDVDNSMIVGFGDRSGHQVGYNNLGVNTSSSQLYYSTCAGDLYRASNNNGTFVLENNGTAGSITTGGAGDGDGPGGGEFYFHDNFSAPWDLGSPTNKYGVVLPAANHDETSIGGLALLTGYGNILQTVFDPLIINDASGGAHSGGVRWYSNSDGTAQDGITLYSNSTPGGLGKASGLGDLELLIDPAPIEIGNRVWMDSDNDGIQDAGEMGLDGIPVKLYNGTTLIATKTTINGGQYYFGTADGVLPNTTYTIRIDGANIPSGKSLTLVDQPSDLVDNDASLVGVNADITFTTGLAGENNHTLDFGFSLPSTASCTGNIIVNPSFESIGGANPYNDGNIATGWTIVGNGGSFDATGSGWTNQDGNRYGGAGGTFGCSCSGEIYQDITGVTPGDTYTFTFYAAQHEPDVNDGTVYIEYRDISNNLVGTRVLHNVEEDFDIPTFGFDGPTTISLPSAPSSATTVRIGITSVYNGGGANNWDMVKADALCLTKTSAPLCSSNITATPGTCNSTSNEYILTGAIQLTNPPSSGTLTIQVVGGGSQTFDLSLGIPTSYSIANLISDGAIHSVDLTISGTSCASSTTYTAPASCTINCPNPNCGTLKSKTIINN